MSTPLIFITGATGFIGSHVALAVLQAGHRVRLSIRDPKQETVLRERYKEFAGSVEVSVIPDLSQQASFDTALQGVDHVFHLASPLATVGGELKTAYIDPAVNGTLAVLRAANAHPQIKKVVIMSSILALTPAVENFIYLDITWNGLYIRAREREREREGERRRTKKSQHREEPRGHSRRPVGRVRR